MTANFRFLVAAVPVIVISACSTDSPIGTSTPATRSLAAVGRVKSPHLFDGIELSPIEKKKMFAINRRYNEQVNALKAQSADTTAPIDAATLGKLRSLRGAQLAEWRGVMSAVNVLRFDHNRQLVDAELAQLRGLHPGSR